ncbi:hypothetical protein D0T84_01175 [Dysgonomonas sp. 521]|uniref:CotH kinase family protein n=1 Tax=Dysgonomonas sp. 521 TaxID=2302932 RepID=UPI0013D1DF92|nr:CotH kinase family protein [Dysgonomonas sp. 521]NDV93528.1 hypothetical protein [Dysgonomonas sp. 521]
MIDLLTILSYYKKGKEPTEKQFADSWKSFWHKSERLPQTQILGLTDALNDLEQNKASHADLEAVKEENKHNLGYFSTLEKLEADIASGTVRQPQAGDKAGILDTGTIWEYKNDSWSDTGVAISEDIPAVYAQLSIISNSEYLFAITDTSTAILCGFRRNGEIYVAKGMPEDTKAALKLKLNYTDVVNVLGNTGKPISDTAVNAAIGAISRILSVVTDNEGRIEVTLDAENRILSYRRKDGTKWECTFETETATINDRIKLSVKAITQLKQDLIDSGFSPGKGTGDWSEQSDIAIPIPRVAARINLIVSRMPSGKFDDIHAILEYWDKDGNYFRKPIILNAQGTSSMAYMVKNLSVDFTDCKIKFGNWVAQDSFHIKKYYIDAFRGQCNVSYKLCEQMYQTRPVGERKPYQSVYPSATAYDGTGILKADIVNEALCHPDGFPVVIYVNEEFYGLYALNLKKHRDNYAANKGDSKHIILDGNLSLSTFWQNNIVWSEFEVRNPKDLIDINGNEYNGDYPKELSNTDVFSKEVKDNIVRLSNALPTFSGSTTKAEFEQYFDVPFFIDYFVHAQFVYNFDGFAKNWIWCTWDGLKWCPTFYDHDSVFGMHWRGNMVKRNSLSAILGLENRLPSYWLNQLYKPEIQARYKELRDKGIFTAENVVNLFNEWVEMIGSDMYKKEFEKWGETPSYRKSYINEAYWKLVGDEWDNGTEYNNATAYNVGDKCKYQTFLFECIDPSTGNAPLTKLYDNVPNALGFYNSIERIEKWVTAKLVNLDLYFNYN